MQLPITLISAEEQNKILEQKLQDRVELQKLVHESNPNYLVNRAVSYDLCANDFVYWCNNYAWLQDPESDDPENKDIPFLLYNFQEEAAREIIKAAKEGYDLPIEKSRAMGMSWTIVCIIVWGWHFQKWDCLLGSEKAEKVDKKGDMGTLIEKCRYIIASQPEWIMPRLNKKEYDKNMLLVSPKHGAKIKGDSNSTKFGRGDRSKILLADEFSSWDKTDIASWRSCKATAKCRICLSTPNERGKNCWYYQVVNNAKKKGLPYLRLHWTLHPLFAADLNYDDEGKPTSPWYEKMKREAVSDIEVAQELDIDYSASATGKVFPSFDLETNVVETVIENGKEVSGLKYNSLLPLYISWDFGLDQTALIWFQPDGKYINIIDEYVNDGTSAEGSDIYHYIDIIDSRNYKDAIHYGDPHSGNNRNLAARGQSNGSILIRNGIRFKKFNKVPKINERISSGRNMMDRIRISDKCILTIDCFSQWQMKKQQSGNASSIPEHDIHSHLGDAYSYFCWGYQENKPTRNNIVKKNYSRSLSGVML